MWSQTCEYALRAATYIARHGTGGSVLAREIAEDMGISHQYLQKVLRGLVLNGVLTSTRGIGGGFRLGRPAEQISLISVIEPFDRINERISCPFGNPACGSENPCPVHDEWSRVVSGYQDFLHTTSLAVLASRESKWTDRSVDPGVSG